VRLGFGRQLHASSTDTADRSGLAARHLAAIVGDLPAQLRLLSNKWRRNCPPIIIDVIGKFQSLLAVPTKQLTLGSAMSSLPISPRRLEREFFFFENWVLAYGTPGIGGGHPVESRFVFLQLGPEF
jgi:hypothetical protein